MAEGPWEDGGPKNELSAKEASLQVARKESKQKREDLDPRTMI